MRHSLNLLVDLGVYNNLREILKDKTPGRKIGMLGVNMGNVNSSVSTDVNHKCRSIIQLGAI